MRVLHLIDPGNPGGGACTLQLLSEPLTRLNSVRQDVLLIGNGFHETLARRCGVTPTGRISAPRQQPALAGFIGEDVRAFLRAYEQAHGPYDIIHAWTARTALLAAVVAGDRKRLATLAVGPVNGLLTRLLARMIDRRPCPLLTTSVSVKRDYIALGVAEEHLDILRPAVHAEAMDDAAADRDTLRERWGIDEADFVVGLLSEPASWADARRAATVLSLAVESGRRVALALHPQARRRLDAWRWAKSLHMHERLILEEELSEPWRCMRGLDAAMLLGDDTTTLDLREQGNPFALLFGGGRMVRPMPGVMPALWAMAAGVPVIAEASLAMQEVVEHGATGLLVPQHDINAAAGHLVRLYDDRPFGREIAAAARAHVQRHYHVSAYCVRLKDMYERIVEGRETRVVDAERNEAVIEQRRFADVRR